MSRLPEIDREHLTAEQELLHSSLQNRPEVQANGLVGPFAAWMHAPELGLSLAELGAKIRFASSLPARATEVAICTTGVFHGSSFEVAAHRPIAIAAGVDAAALDRLAAGDEPGFTGDERAAHSVATELLQHHAIDPETYADAVARFGTQGMVELVTTIGYYVLNALLLNGFEIPLAPGMDDPLPSA